ncbi:zinc finger protein 106-like isoform X2 [Pecten maximus]|uniref:zinc finger protein 106-like isoform X2 n=1 Tax=Pecten maximus TaxID=6579 RepID=UPI001458983F|nr:zinc finger protein 106-like isoform X2 [Pecten maximus]
MDLDMDANQSFEQEGMEKDDLECDLCKISYSHEQELRDHAWSLMHHINMEKKKKGSTHNCTLCFATCPNIIEYGKHLNGEKHKRAAEGQRRQKEKETMTFQKEALLNKRVQDESVLPGQLENEGNLSDPELSRQFKSLRHGKSHQRSHSQPYIKGKGKNKTFKGKGDDRFSSNDAPRFDPRERNTDFHDGNQNNAFWENDYNVNWEGGGFVQQPDWGFHRQSNWDGPWWDGNNMNPHRDEFSNFYPRYQTRYSQQRQHDKNMQFKGTKQYNRWNRRDNSNERYRHGDQDDDSYWNRGSDSGRYYRNRRDHSWDRTDEYNHFDRPSRDFPSHMNESQHDLSVDNDMAGQKRRCTSDEKNKSKSRKKNVNFENPTHQRKNSVEMDLDSRVTRDSENLEDINKNPVVESALEPDSTTEEVTLDRKVSKGKKKDKSKKKKSSGVKSVREANYLEDQHGSNVLEQAEQLCRELRDKRQLVKKEREKIERKKKMEKAEEINSQISNLSKINQSYLKGHIAGCADLIASETVDSDKSTNLINVRSRTQKEHDIDDIRKGIESVVDAGKQLSGKQEPEKDSDLEVKSSTSKYESVVNKKSSKPKSDKAGDESDLSTNVAHPHNSPTTKTPVSEPESIHPLKIGTFSPFHQESLSRQSSRASSDMSTDLDPESKKDTLLKMVNSPRSRKERERLAKMLRSYAFSQNKLSLPRFNFQISDLTAELDGVATELRLEDLSADVQLQIAELIEADIKPDLSSLEPLVFESQKSTSVDREPVQSHDVNMIPVSAENVPTRDFVKRKTLQEPKASTGMTSETRTYLQENIDFHKILDPSADKKDKMPNFNPDLCIKSEELSEPEQMNFKSEPVWEVNQSNVDSSKPTNKSLHKHSRDVTGSMHYIDDSEPVLLKENAEPVQGSSHSSVSKPQAELLSGTEPALSIGSSNSHRLKETSEHLNSKSQTDSEPSKDKSKPVRSADKGEVVPSREKLTRQSRNNPTWSRDTSDPVWGGEMPELSMADLSSNPVRIKQEFTRLEDLISTNKPAETSFVSKDSPTQHSILPSQDTGRETIARLEEQDGSKMTFNKSEKGPPLSKGLERCDLATLGSVGHNRAGLGNLDLGSSLPEKAYTDRAVPRTIDESNTPVGGQVDSHKPGMADPTTGDEARPDSLSSSTSGSVFDLVYDLSVEEDSLRQEMTSAESEIMRLTALIQTATEQLSTQRTRHLQLSRKEQSIRSRRLHVLREAKSLQNLSMEMPGKPVDRAAISDCGPFHSSSLTAESSDLDSSRDSNFTRVSPLSSFSHDHRGTSKNGNTSDCLVVLSDSSDSSINRKGMGGFSSSQGLNSKEMAGFSSPQRQNRKDIGGISSQLGQNRNELGGFPASQGLNRKESGSVYSPLNSQRISPTIIQNLPPPLEPSRDSEGFIEPNKHTLKTYETSKEGVRSTDSNRDTLSSVVPSQDTVSLDRKDAIKAFQSQEKLVRPASPDIGTVRSVSPNLGAVRSVSPNVGTVRSASPNLGAVRSVSSNVGVVRSASPNLGSVRSVSPNVGPVRSASPNVGPVRSASPNVGVVRSVSPNVGAVRSVRSNVDTVRFTEMMKDNNSINTQASRDSTESLEPTKDTVIITKDPAEIDQSTSIASSVEENRFVTLKALLRASPQATRPGNETLTNNDTLGMKLPADDQISNAAVSSTTAEFTLPQVVESRQTKVTDTTQPKVNVQYMGHLPGNLFTGQKENMFEKLQSFLKSSRSDQGYRSESSLKSDEIVLDTDSNQESVASNASLGEKIRQYCKENRRGSTQLDSGSEHTLKGSNSETNTPVRQQSKPPVSPSVSDDKNLSPSRKRRKTKKERDQSSKRKQKEEYVINSSSECSGQDDENIPLTDLRQRLQFQVGPEELEDICMVETGSDDCAVRGTEQRRSLLEEVQLDSPNESEENFNQVKSHRFRLGPERLASVRAAVKSTIHRSDKGRAEDAVKQLVGPADSVTHIQVAGQSVFVAYQKSNPCHFNLESGTLLGQYDCSPCCVRSLAVVTIDNKLCLYACGPSERLFLFDCETYAILKDMELIYQVQCMHESWGRLYLGTDYGAVIGKDAKTGKTFESFQCCDQSVTCIASGLEGVRKILLVAAYTSPIYVCDAISGLLLRMLEGHTKTVFCMEVAGHMVYSGSGDRKVVEHDLLTSDVSWSYGDSEGLVRGVTTDKQGCVFYGGQDQYIRCRNRQTHQLHCLFHVGKSPVVSNIATYQDKILYGNKEGVVEVLTVERNPHKCQCGDCSYMFGLKSHLLHHMVSDHLTQNSRLFSCPWTGCTNRLSTYQDSKEAEEHLKEHIE